jgi:ketosteroid isomerase-like protein
VGGASPAVAIAQRPAEKAAPEKPKPVAEKPAEKSTEKPVAEKPADKPVAAKPAAAEPGAEVLVAVNAWAQAWSKKDADAYLSYYAKDFKLPGKETRADWEKTRRTRIGSAKTIKVAIGSPKVTMNGTNEATVVFQQTYQSDTFKSAGRKSLVMSKADGRWQIREEKSI